MATIKNNNNDKYGRKKQLKPKQKRHAITENDNIKGSENKKLKPTIRVISKESNAMINRKNPNVHGQLYSPQLKKTTLMSSRHQRPQIRDEFFPTRKKKDFPFTDISLNSTVQNNDITIGVSELNETSINTSAIPLAESPMIDGIPFDQSINNNTLNGDDRDINENNDFDNKSRSDGEPKKESIFNKIRGFFSTFISGIVSFFKSFVGFIMSPFTKQQDTHESTFEKSAQQHNLNNDEEVNIQQPQNELTNDVIIDNDAQQQQQVNSYIDEKSPTILNRTQTKSSLLDEIDNDSLNDFSLEYNPYNSPYF